jgi:adenosylcobinamide amidohydrolase
MYQDVKAWLNSGMRKKDFVKNKQYNKNKFDYWCREHKVERQSQELRESNNFKEVMLFPIEEAKMRKVLEIESPGGFKITVFE